MPADDQPTPRAVTRRQLAVDRVIRAVLVEGPRPDVHRAALERLRRDWPELHAALMELVATC